jgi:methylmalonyl-CoA epimerase
MRAVLDHVGIAVRDVQAALAFYRDALGLEVEGVEEVTSQRVRAHFLPVGESSLELLEPTSPDSPIAQYLEKRGPGLHHITLRVEDIAAALDHLKGRGARLIDEHPRPGAEGAMIAFVHPSAAHGVLVELKQAGVARSGQSGRTGEDLGPLPDQPVQRFAVGDLELLSLHDGFFHLDGGAMFGIVPKPLWERKAPSDARNRIRIAMRPLVIRGVRTMIIDAGLGEHGDAKFQDIYGVERARNLDHTLAEAGLAPDAIDIVLASHLHFDHAGGFTRRDGAGRLRPRFPRARYVVRRGEWDDALHTHERNRASYLTETLLPLAEAGVLEMVDDDQTIMPGVRVRRTGGHTMHHQSVWIESGGRSAVYVGDVVPTLAHLAAPWIMGIDLYPVETLAAKKAFVEEAERRQALVFLPHDPHVAAGFIQKGHTPNGRPEMVAASSSD